MKKTHYIIIFAVLLAIFSFIGIYFEKKGKKPFEDLKETDISSATVLLLPPNKTIRITDFKKLTEYLNEVIIYDRDDSYSVSGGQDVTFTVTMKDGTKMKITVYNPFILIDDVGYRCKYEPCEKLNRYANKLLENN